MRVEGSYTYPADPAVVWSLLGEPGRAARILPGCQVLETLDSRHHRAVLSLRVGKTIEQLAVALELSEVTPGQALDFKARAQGLSGSLKIDGHISLTQPEPGCTELSYTAEVNGDQFPGVSPRMLATTARAFARRSLEALDRELAARTRVYSTTVLPEQPTAPVAFDSRLAAFRRVAALALFLLALALIGRGLDRRRGAGQAVLPAERSAA